jgi:hypothetical protein
MNSPLIDYADVVSMADEAFNKISAVGAEGSTGRVELAVEDLLVGEACGNCGWRKCRCGKQLGETDQAVAVMETVAAPNKIKKWLKQYDAYKRMIYQGRSQKVRAMFDRADMPPRERQIRNQIKSAGFWVR